MVSTEAPDYYMIIIFLLTFIFHGAKFFPLIKAIVDLTKEAPLFFIHSSVGSYVAFVLPLLVPMFFFFSFCASGRRCFVIVAFPGYLYL